MALPPTPDTLHLGYSYLHSSYRFLSTWSAVMLKTEIVVKSFFCNTLHTGFTIFCCYWTSISHFTTYQNNYHSLFTHVLQAIQNLTQNFVCQYFKCNFFHPITTFLLFQQYTGSLFLHNYSNNLSQLYNWWCQCKLLTLYYSYILATILTQLKIEYTAEGQLVNLRLLDPLMLPHFWPSAKMYIMSQ